MITRRRPAKTAPPIPRRPRLRPGVVALRRRPGEIQFGLEPGRAIVATDLPEPLADIATGLTGDHTAAELLDRVGPDHHTALRALLQRLADGGLLDDATAPPRADPSDLARSMVQVRGNGRIAVAVALLLAGAGVGHLRVETSGLVTADDLGTGLTHHDLFEPRQTAIHQALRRASESVHLARFTRRGPDLVLLTDALVPDPAVVGPLMDARVPHLTVRVRAGVGLVGPLVVPGATACLTCGDHHRADRDPCWPGVAAQLVGRPQAADLFAVQTTAALAAAQTVAALAWLRRPGPILPPTWNRTLEIDPAAGTLNHRPWSPHPWCGCAASGRPHTAIGCAAAVRQGRIVT
ncbi:hypothetical protein [Alloactinosynnema sp. L-07]|nr:hypothetical protein [Alloactinosynnema sp. L-07]